MCKGTTCWSLRFFSVFCLARTTRYQPNIILQRRTSRPVVKIRFQTQRAYAHLQSVYVNGWAPTSWLDVLMSRSRLLSRSKQYSLSVPFQVMLMWYVSLCARRNCVCPTADALQAPPCYAGRIGYSLDRQSGMGTVTPS